MADMEMESYKREMHRKPESCNITTPDQTKPSIRNKKNRTARHGYRTRATRGEEDEEDDFDNTGSSGSNNESSSNAEEMCTDSDSSSDSSSEYSDWMADHGECLEPPKRSKRKRVQKRPVTPPSDSDRRRSQRPKKKVFQTCVFFF